MLEFKKLKINQDLLKQNEVLNNYETEMFDKDCNQFLIDHILIRKFFNEPIVKKAET